jgi:hypothetical protein
MTSRSIIHIDLHKPNNKFIHNIQTELIRSHHLPLIVLFFINQEQYIQMSFVPKLPIFNS